MTQEQVEKQVDPESVALSRAANEYVLRGWTFADPVDIVREAFKAGAAYERAILAARSDQPEARCVVCGLTAGGGLHTDPYPTTGPEAEQHHPFQPAARPAATAEAEQADAGADEVSRFPSILSQMDDDPVVQMYDRIDDERRHEAIARADAAEAELAAMLASQAALRDALAECVRVLWDEANSEYVGPQGPLQEGAHLRVAAERGQRALLAGEPTQEEPE